jgi:hypothetical protein
MPDYLSQDSNKHYFQRLMKTHVHIPAYKFLLTVTCCQVYSDKSNINNTSLENMKRKLSVSDHVHKKEKVAKKDIDYDTIIEEYKTRLESIWEDKESVVEVWWSEDPIILDCKYIIPNGKRASGFRFQGTKWQYDLRSYNMGRPMAWRIPFLNNPNYGKSGYTVSHLCHDPDCYNWRHHILETLDQNKARNGCPAGDHCHHSIKCLRPGQYYNF